MRKATKKDRDFIVDILSKSFETNPSVLWVVKKDNHLKKRIRELCRYSFKTALLRDGAYISSNESGVALCYRYNSHKEGLKDYINQASLLLNAIGLDRLGAVLKRESYVKSQRPRSGDFLYFWFLGTHPDRQDGAAARELKNHLLQMADDQQLPIYLETSVDKNKNVYRRYGFEVYHEWIYDNGKTTMYFMRRTPKLPAE